MSLNNPLAMAIQSSAILIPYGNWLNKNTNIKLIISGSKTLRH